MITLLSPAKTLDFAPVDHPLAASQPDLLPRSEALIDVLTTYSPHDLQQLMGISESLAELNVERFHAFETPFNERNAKPAALAFKGDVYTGLQAETFTKDEFEYAQSHLRILSGLYGVLRPLDLMQAYRLEMGTRLKTPEGDNLYQFWGDRITQEINNDLSHSGSNVLLNLASNEYFKAVKRGLLTAEIVTPGFKHLRNGQYKMISFFAKKARGVMAAWVIRNRINDANDLLEFAEGGFRFNASLSKPNAPVFTNDDQ